MIYYWLHLIYIFIGSKLFWKKVDLDTNITRTRIVSVFDCESLTYMANSRYFYYMDLIRYEIMFRSSLYENTVKKGMFGVIGSQKIIYKKPLKRWTTFNITLILEGWDEKWVYHRQIFKHNNEVYAIGLTKITFWKNKKAQNINEIMDNCGLTENKLSQSSEILNAFKNDYNIIKNAT